MFDLVPTATSRKTAKPPTLFYGWVIVCISALGIFFSSPGQTYGVSAFIDSFIAEFGWSRAFVSSAYSIATMLAGFMLLMVGRQIDKRGHRFMLPTIALCFGFALLLMSLIRSPLMLFFGFFSIRLFGQGSLTLVSSTLTPQWFSRNRGKAMSLASLGGVLGAALTPPFNTWMITNFGWRTGFLVWAVLLWSVLTPLASLLIRNKPEDIGLLPDAMQKEDASKAPKEASSFTLWEAKRTRSFWLILFAMFIPSMVNTGVTFHFLSILGQQGINPSEAASILSLLAIIALGSTFVAGFLLDRYPIRYILSLSFVGQAVSILLLLITRSFFLAILYGVIRGITAGFESMSFNVVWPNYFGRRHLGSIRGFSMMATVIGSAFGPLPFGIAFDRFQGYTEILLLMLLFPLAGMVSSLFATAPKKPGTQEQGF